MRRPARGTRGGAGPRPRRAGGRRGFTLIETALATIIVGVGVLAIVAAQTAFHQQNSWSTHASIAERLGNEIREMTFALPRHDPVTGTSFWGPETNETSVDDYDDLDDFDGGGGGLIFSGIPDSDGNVNGPLNARREIIPNMAGWEQVVRVYSVDPFNINSTQADATTDMIVVEVLVRYQAPGETSPQDMTTVSWLAPQ